MRKIVSLIKEALESREKTESVFYEKFQEIIDGLQSYVNDQRVVACAILREVEKDGNLVLIKPHTWFTFPPSFRRDVEEKDSTLVLASGAYSDLYTVITSLINHREELAQSIVYLLSDKRYNYLLSFPVFSVSRDTFFGWAIEQKLFKNKDLQVLFSLGCGDYQLNIDLDSIPQYGKGEEDEEEDIF